MRFEQSLGEGEGANCAVLEEEDPREREELEPRPPWQGQTFLKTEKQPVSLQQSAAEMRKRWGEGKQGASILQDLGATEILSV